MHLAVMGISKLPVFVQVQASKSTTKTLQLALFCSQRTNSQVSQRTRGAPATSEVKTSAFLIHEPTSPSAVTTCIRRVQTSFL